MASKRKRARKSPAERATRRRPTARSFRDYARKLRADNAPLKMFKNYALGDEFPAGESWQEVRGYLVRAGAEHEALVGARLAWREFRIGLA